MFKDIEENQTLIEILEKETNMELGKVIFDSDKNDWKINSSIFDEMIVGKEQLLFLIYPKLSYMIYGGMIYNKIDRYIVDEQDNEINGAFTVHGLHKNASLNHHFNVYQIELE